MQFAVLVAEIDDSVAQLADSVAQLADSVAQLSASVPHLYLLLTVLPCLSASHNTTLTHGLIDQKDHTL